MAANIPEIEPTEVIAGDTIKWTKDLSDYPATSWTLNYYLRGPSPISITATASGRTHSVTVSTTTSATWPSGTYHWESFVTSGGERYKVGEGRMVVEVNPATSTLNYETRTPAKQILDALMATQLNLAGRKENRYRIEAAGREFNFYTHEDLIVAIQFWQAEVLREEQAEAIARGENTGKNIFVRFN